MKNSNNLTCSSMKMFCSTVIKPTPSTPLGLRLWEAPRPSISDHDGRGGAILIVHIDDHGLFAKKLKPGMQIESINGKSIHAIAAAAAAAAAAGTSSSSAASAAAIQAYLNKLQGRVCIMASLPMPFRPPQQQPSSLPSLTRDLTSDISKTPPPRLLDITLDHDEAAASDSDDDNSLSALATTSVFSLMDEDDCDYGYNLYDDDDSKTLSSFLVSLARMVF